MRDTPLGAINESNKRLRAIFDILTNSVAKREILTYTGSLAADTDVVAAVPGKKIVVIGYSLMTASTSATTVTFKSDGTSGTALFTVGLQAVTNTYTSGVSNYVAPPGQIFSTERGKKLTADFSAANTVLINLTYYLD